MMETGRITGGCHCGAVQFQLTGPVRGVVNCHCSQCVKTHGHFIAYSRAAKSDLKLEGTEHLTWYNASPDARRAFCAKCGSRIFWERKGSDNISIAAGAFDMPSGLKTLGNIYVADKPDYYEINDGLPAFPKSDDGAL